MIGLSGVPRGEVGGLETRDEEGVDANLNVARVAGRDVVGDQLARLAQQAEWLVV